MPFYASNGYKGIPLVSVQESDAPSGGAYMLQLNSYQSDWFGFSFTDSNGTDWQFAPSRYTISLQQELSLSANDLVSGLARFVTSDLPDYGDYASVTIGNEIVWHQEIADVFDPETYEEESFSYGGWQEWMWSAPSDGTYQLSLNIYGDDQFDSLAYFDNIAALPSASGPDAVPDSGAAVTLLGIALVVCGAFGQRLKHSPV